MNAGICDDHQRIPVRGIDGAGIEAAAPIGDQFQVRAGYSIFPYTYTQKLNYDNVKIGSTRRDLRSVPVNATLWKGGVANLLFDYYPGGKSFHVTAGAYIGGGKFASADIDMTSALTPDEYGTLAIGTETGPTFSTDKKGIAHIDAKTGAFLPYLGIGFGRVFKDSRVGLNVDLGVIISGGMKAQSYNYIRNTLNESSPVEVIQITSATLENKDDGLVDKISGIPVLPMLKFSVFYRIF